MLISNFDIITIYSIRKRAPNGMTVFKIFYRNPCIAGNNCYLCESMKKNTVILHHHHPIS